MLPKNILKAPSHNPVDPNASPAYAALPNPSSAHPLRNPDQRFLDSEAFTLKFASHIGGPMEKVTRRVIRRWSGTFNLLCVSARERPSSRPKIMRGTMPTWVRPSTVSA